MPNSGSVSIDLMGSVEPINFSGNIKKKKYIYLAVFNLFAISQNFGTCRLKMLTESLHRIRIKTRAPAMILNWQVQMINIVYFWSKKCCRNQEFQTFFKMKRWKVLLSKSTGSMEPLEPVLTGALLYLIQRVMGQFDLT